MFRVGDLDLREASGRIGKAESVGGYRLDFIYEWVKAKENRRHWLTICAKRVPQASR